MAITAAARRSTLEDAWDVAKVSVPVDLRAVLRSEETKARKAIAGGSLASVSANRRTSEFSGYGPGQITQAEILEILRGLVDLYDGSKKWLTDCATYALDPAQTELTGWPTNPGPSVASPAAITEESIYTWMMNHLVAVYTAGSDQSGLRFAAFGGWT